MISQTLGRHGEFLGQEMTTVSCFRKTNLWTVVSVETLRKNDSKDCICDGGIGLAGREVGSNGVDTLCWRSSRKAQQQLGSEVCERISTANVFRWIVKKMMASLNTREKSRKDTD